LVWGGGVVGWVCWVGGWVWVGGGGGGEAGTDRGTLCSVGVEERLPVV